MNEEVSLMDGAGRMDREALVAIFDRFAMPLYNFAMRICGDPLHADQVVGDVFTKFLEQLAAGKGPRTNLRSYLYEMTYNLVMDGFRHSRREAPLELTESELERDNGHRSMDTNLENKLLMDALILAIKAELSADQRHVIVLRFAEGFSLLETAQIVGRAAGTVKVTQSRALAKLRKVLDLSKVNA
jgi:RNA polymerase sigma-70 factor, ECF subfamily